MNESKRPSGAEYRKRKKQQEESKKKLPKIDLFFKKDSSECTSSKCSEGELHEATEGKESPFREVISLTLNETPENIVNINCKQGENTENVSATVSNPNTTNTDIGLYSDEDLKNDNFKSIILNGVPCRHQGPFPKDPTTNRSFSADYYYCNTKTGHKIDRFWLCYSPTLNGVYCEPCWLFANRLDKNFSNAWCTGKINDWKNLSNKIKDHETSKCHINACMSYGVRKNNRDIKVLFTENLGRMKEVFKRILDVVITMSKCNLAFRGHRSEQPKSITSESGNFLNVVALLSRYDPVLRSHLEDENSKIKYLSPKIQNELIDLASSQVLSNIILEIQNAYFYSLILDTTQDISRTDQLSIVIRHVVYQPDTEQLEISESFLGFLPVADQSAKGLEEKVIEFLDE